MSLIQQTIPKDKAFGFMVTAFGKQFGLCPENGLCDEKFIKTFCKKTEERLLFELNQHNKIN